MNFGLVGGVFEMQQQQGSHEEEEFGKAPLRERRNKEDSRTGYI